MKHYIITNRQINRDASGTEFINPDGRELASDILRFAEYDSTTNQVFLYPDLITPDTNYRFPIEQRSIENSTGSELFFSNLFRDMSAAPTNNETLVYIHGFNTKFSTALDDIKKLESHYILQGNTPIKRIVIFSWPSNAEILEYRADRRDAEISGYALARTYSKLIKFFHQFFAKTRSNQPLNEPCDQNIHLMCHSMGCYVLESMLANLIRFRFPLTTVIKEILLMAADVNWNVLEQPYAMYNITKICYRVHTYYHLEDNALTVSETTKNALNRLGKFGPQNISKIPQNVNVVDVSQVNDIPLLSSFVNHSYFKESQKVIADISAVLRGEHSENIANRKYIPHKNIFRL